VVMAPHVLLYQLLVVALVLLCLLRHLWWPDHPSAALQTPLQSDKPRRKRSSEPKPVTGFIHTPLCEACAKGTDRHPKAPGSPPPLLPCTRGRKRTVNTPAHCWPKPTCSSQGWLGRGHSRANGHPGGQPWRQWQCVSCPGSFSETHGTLCHGKRASPELLGRVIACLAAGLGIRGAARVFELAPHTVLQWLVEAAAQLQALSAYVLSALPIKQVQLDERSAVLRAVREGAVSAADAIADLSRSPHWVWTAIAPQSKRLLSVPVGERTWAMAPAMLPQIAPLVAPGCGPLLLSAGYAHDLTAIMPPVGPWVQPPRRHARGPAPTPRWRPLPALRYAQVVKPLRWRRLVEVKQCVVCGTNAVVAQVLATCGGQIGTAFVARLHRSRRQQVAAMRRRSAMSGKREEGWSQPLILFPVDHHFVWPQMSLRQALAEPLPTNGSGSAKQWRPCTPALAAGLTDHGWSRKEVWRYRVPPWPQPQVLEDLAPCEQRGVEWRRSAHMPHQRLAEGVEDTV
jgi:transposase-like protein